MISRHLFPSTGAFSARLPIAGAALALLLPMLGGCLSRPPAARATIAPTPVAGPLALRTAPVVAVPVAPAPPPVLAVAPPPPPPPAPPVLAQLAPPPPLQVIDPPVEPGRPVAFVKGSAGPAPILVYQTPERINPRGQPAILPPPVDHGDRQQTLIEARPTRIVVGRGAADQRRLLSTIEDVGGGRFDAVHLEIKGEDRDAAQAVARTARRAGVEPGKIKYAAGSARRGTVDVAVIRFVAIPPTCASQAFVGPSVEYNDFEVSTGCSTRNNLAQMVSDPADLLMNNIRVPADGARAVIAIEQYRSGSGQTGRGAGSTSASAGVDTSALGGFSGGAGTFLGSGGAVSR